MHSSSPFFYTLLIRVLQPILDHEPGTDLDCNLSDNKISKPERVKRLIQNTICKINKKEILEKCPDISKKTVERALADLVKEGLIEKVGASSATAYVWIQK